MTEHASTPPELAAADGSPFLRPLLVSLYPEAARMLGVERSCVIKLADAGELETVKIGRRRLAVVESVGTYVERLRAGKRSS